MTGAVVSTVKPRAGVLPSASQGCVRRGVRCAVRCAVQRACTHRLLFLRQREPLEQQLAGLLQLCPQTSTRAHTGAGHCCTVSRAAASRNAGLGLRIPTSVLFVKPQSIICRSSESRGQFGYGHRASAMVISGSSRWLVFRHFYALFLIIKKSATVRFFKYKKSRPQGDQKLP